MKKGKVVVITYLDNFPNRFPTWHEFQPPGTVGANLEWFLQKAKISCKEVVWCDVDPSKQIDFYEIFRKISKQSVRAVVIESTVFNHVNSFIKLSFEALCDMIGGKPTPGHLVNSEELDARHYSSEESYCNSLACTSAGSHEVYGCVSSPTHPQYLELLKFLNRVAA